ncbi:hypothetical protein F5Y16DRAFT_358350 [Xylariaceae sp. FL0255]|nr:hypothetical protein F5Y16DRAFT_358350 [Xylariaceae sp. FL0255]
MAPVEEPQPQKRVRVSRPKVKTGCNNCKQRRIKCDELRPACTQCVRSKKHCHGYPPPPRFPAYKAPPIRPKPASLQPAPLIAPLGQRPLVSRPVAAIMPAPPQQPSLTPTPPESPEDSILTLHRPGIIPFDAQEGQYFQLFRDNTASELSGFFDSSFWTRRVLQECHSQNSIKHAVVALGALYKTLEKMSESPPGSPSDMLDHVDNANRHWEVAYKHYSLAIRALVSSTSDDQVGQRTSLMASVLLACFDSFIGDHKQAIVQIQSGLSLLETLRAERRRAKLSNPEEPVEQDLMQMFTRLAIQAKSYDMAFHFPKPYVIRLSPKSPDESSSAASDEAAPPSTQPVPIPEVFASLHDGRLAWDTICQRTMRFTEEMSTFVTMSPMGILPLQLKQYGIGFNIQMEAWSRAFEPILASRMAPAKSSQEKTAIAVLKMNQIMGQTLFNMAFNDSEMEFDSYLSFFRDICNLASEVIGDEERRAKAKRCPNPEFCQHHPSHPDIFGGQFTANHIKPSFSADMGIVPPLFVVATKCRDPLIRRQAIQLLRTSSRREGMWDSEMCARIGTWIATVEEEEDINVDTRRPVSNASESSRHTSPTVRSHGSPPFIDEMPLGPGGNARWGSRRDSTPVSPQAPITRMIPENKRVMIRAVEFDLQKRVAVLQCGTRGLIPGMPDLRTRATKVVW